MDVLQDVRLELHGGELGGIWGRRGTGKTTIAHVAAGLIVPDAGRVILDGTPLRERTRAVRHGALQATIGFASRQGPHVGEVTIAQWIGSALVSSHTHGQALQLAHRALGKTGTGHLATASWSELSGGERMLVAIARAIVRGPRLLVVDDPVAGLGGSERGEIMQLLRSIAALGVGVLVTAAELIELQGMDRIWMLRDGRVEGPTVRAGGDVVPLRRPDSRLA
ncbi:MAG TPA: ATP-binding cassette domain-containing protein [Baekduia sp.]